MRRKTGRLSILLLLTAAIGSSVVWGAGCAPKGPAQRAGEKFDRAIDDMKDAVDPPGPAQKAGRAIDRTIDNVTH